MSLSNAIHNNDITLFQNLIDNDVGVTQNDIFLIVINGKINMLEYLQQINNNRIQVGGYYGSPELKEALIQNMRGNECPVCHKMTNDILNHMRRNHTMFESLFNNTTEKEKLTVKNRRDSLKYQQALQKYKRRNSNIKNSNLQ